jgi:hypothetical protein
VEEKEEVHSTATREKKGRVEGEVDVVLTFILQDAERKLGCGGGQPSYGSNE